MLTNVASGNELHKEAVMHQLLPQPDEGTKHFILKFLQSSNSQLRTATVWLIINLTSPSSPTAVSRHAKLRNAGIISQIKNMGNDPCLDVKVIRFTPFLNLGYIWRTQKKCLWNLFEDMHFSYL